MSLEEKNYASYSKNIQYTSTTIAWRTNPLLDVS